MTTPTVHPATRRDYSPADPGPMRGVVIGTALSLPFWVALAGAVVAVGRCWS